jgi:hypothetical protein
VGARRGRGARRTYDPGGGSPLHFNRASEVGSARWAQLLWLDDRDVRTGQHRPNLGFGNRRNTRIKKWRLACGSRRRMPPKPALRFQRGVLCASGLRAAANEQTAVQIAQCEHQIRRRQRDEVRHLKVYRARGRALAVTVQRFRGRAASYGLFEELTLTGRTGSGHMDDFRCSGGNYLRANPQ